MAVRLHHADRDFEAAFDQLLNAKREQSPEVNDAVSSHTVELDDDGAYVITVGTSPSEGAWLRVPSGVRRIVLYLRVVPVGYGAYSVMMMVSASFTNASCCALCCAARPVAGEAEAGRPA